MSQPISESASLSESMLRLIESAPLVKRRHQFFLWTQGDLQRWIPHKLLVCGAYDRASRDMVLDLFNSLPMSVASLRGLQSVRDTVLVMALSRWRQMRYQPCWLDLRQIPFDDEAVSALIADGYTQLMIHGLNRPSRPDEVESIFIFGMPAQLVEEDALKAIDMLLPCLHMTYQRVHVTELGMGKGTSTASAGSSASSMSSAARAGANTAAHKPAVTEREREILMWVRDGMSNQQISEKLGISALTVKNHVQKILRKLGAANRAQAVGKAMNMNLLGGGADQGVS